MGKSVWCDDETYERILDESHRIGVPISQLLKVIVNSEEKLRKSQQKIDKEKAEEKIEKKVEKNELKNQEKNDQKSEQKNIEKNKKLEVKEMPDLSEKDVRNIILDVLKQEKREEQRNGELKELKKNVESLQKLFCTPDGRKCFVTPQELQEFEKKQKKAVDESLQDIKKTLNEIKDNEVKERAEAMAEEPEMLRNLRGRKWDELSLSEQEAVKNDLSQNFSHRALAETLLSCPECSLALKRRVLSQMSEEELAQASKTCVGDTCTLIKSELDERGKRKYFMRDEKGEWKPAELKLEKRKSRSKF